jgi:hypothetical protein
MLLPGGRNQSAPPEPAVPRELLDARSKAAGDSFREAWLLYREGRTRDVDRIYLWSLRWREAQEEASTRHADQLAASEAHEKRMRQLEDLIRTRFRAGVAAPVELPEVTYYRAEAEILTARLKTVAK